MTIAIPATATPTNTHTPVPTPTAILSRIGSIVSPQLGVTLTTSTLNVSGWALDGTGVSRVLVYLNGFYLGEASVGQAVSECYRFPQYADCASAGWIFPMRLSMANNGAAVISAYAVDSSGNPFPLGTSTVTIAIAPTPTATITLTPSATPTAIPPGIGAMTAPAAAATLNTSTATVSGWALDGTGVSSVQVYLNGRYAGSATLGQAINQCASYPAYAGCAAAGWTFPLRLSMANNGAGIISAYAMNGAGQPFLIGSRSVTIAIAPTATPSATPAPSLTPTALPGMIGAIEAPAASATLGGPSVKISGWALDGAGVDRILIYLNGYYAATASYGAARADLCALYPAYASCNGGWSADLRVSPANNGPATIYVYAVSASGQPYLLGSRAVVFAVEENSATATPHGAVLPGIGAIEAPANGALIDSVTSAVSGWALSGRGVSRIAVYLNGHYLGDAAYGQERPDVCALHPDYTNCTPGWSFPLILGPADSGPAEIKAYAVDTIGQPSLLGTISATIQIPDTPAIAPYQPEQLSAQIYSTYTGLVLEGPIYPPPYGPLSCQRLYGVISGGTAPYTVSIYAYLAAEEQQGNLQPYDSFVTTDTSFETAALPVSSTMVTCPDDPLFGVSAPGHWHAFIMVTDSMGETYDSRVEGPGQGSVPEWEVGEYFTHRFE